MRSETSLTTITLALALLSAGCIGAGVADNVDKAPEAIPLTILAAEYELQVPATIPAGLLDVTLVNEGVEPHHVTFYKLAAGRTLDELREALVATHGAAPEWVTAHGGPNAAMPGAPTRAYIELEPGEYVVACLIPSLDHRMHLEKGMLAAVTVVASDEEAAMPPAAHATVTLRDFGFDVAGPLHAGESLVRVVNAGSHTHEMVVFELFGNATTMEFLQAMKGDGSTPPPGRPVGGVSFLSPGMESTVALSLTPGRYAMVCFDVQGTEHGEPHFLAGMTHEFVIE